MALTQTARVEGVSINGKRTVTYTCAFSDGTAADVTLASLGLRVVDEVYVRVPTSGASGVDLTANDATKVTLDPVAATTVDITFVGS